MLKKSPTVKLYIRRCFKRAWTTKKLAKIALKKQSGTKRRLKAAYECPRCGKWHLTHLSTKEYERKVADWLLIKFLENDLKQQD